MPCYVCEKCGCVDNTALGGNFWSYARSSFIAKNKGEHKEGCEKLKGYIPALCCECNTGKWHNQFPKLHITANEYYKNNTKELMNPEVAKRFLESEEK